MPFEVLLDEDGSAAQVAGTKTGKLTAFLDPRLYLAAAKSVRAGSRQHKTGRRPDQLGATLVVGPGNELIYSDFEDFAGDHADLDEVIAALSI